MLRLLARLIAALSCYLNASVLSEAAFTSSFSSIEPSNSSDIGRKSNGVYLCARTLKPSFACLVCSRYGKGSAFHFAAAG